MNVLQLVKYDLYSIVKSPLTYIALLLTIAPQVLITCLVVNQTHKIDGDMLIGMAIWFFSVTGLLFVIRTITRDMAQGTLQLYMNKKKNRLGYTIAKFISIILIAILFTVLLTVYVQIVQGLTDGDNVKFNKFVDILWFYIIFFLFYGLLLYLVAMIVPKPALIFTLGIFLILVVPFAEPFLPMIPKFGEKIQHSLKYIPFSYLTKKTQSSNQTFTHWQWFITPASIVVLFIVNLFYGAKKDI
ncbi:ABC transporter permease subunit [Staphylococcus sp. SQ8-PEA]|uniref:ABC transporter permease subunit n=1 Tax=Staphylococcus marylandisciuri TaxID=2981529 RepID=A0ABT2QQF4_9STAP|nr:ABC transporter permease subunit [Staphylococcus marylandisciuri]MCU5746180.1 ABC transporter permease subunit [Staphylococcus marylandisciuri]